MSYAPLSLTDSAIRRRAKIVATLGPASNTEPVFTIWSAPASMWFALTFLTAPTRRSWR